MLLGRGLFEAAMRLQGDEGARRLIGSLGAGELIEVEAPDAGVVVDIDTPERPCGGQAACVGDGR